MSCWAAWLHTASYGYETSQITQVNPKGNRICNPPMSFAPVCSHISDGMSRLGSEYTNEAPLKIRKKRPLFGHVSIMPSSSKPSSLASEQNLIPTNESFSGPTVPVRITKTDEPSFHFFSNAKASSGEQYICDSLPSIML